MAATSLPERDVAWVERSVPLIWPVLKAWFRPDVRGLDRIPAEGPVLLVGNHSGGNVAPDTLVFTAAFIRRFGARRPFFQLAHHLVVAAPWLALLRRYGTITASPGNARAALSEGAAVLVYPGGDWEAHRPVWQGHRIDFHGRHGFVRLAIETGVPLIPVVAIGGQETALFLSRGERRGAGARPPPPAPPATCFPSRSRCPGGSTSAMSSATSRCRRRSRSRCSSRSTSRARARR